MHAVITLLLALAPVAQSDTVVRVENRPLHPGVATLVEELSIGVADGPEHFMLGDIADIGIGRDGSIYAIDRQVPTIRHYDASGKYLGSIGRKGQGPGEYMSVSGLAIARDGQVLLWDTGTWRVNVYSASGDNVTQWSTPASGTAQFSRAIMVDTAGRVITRKNIFSRNPADRPIVWIRYRPDGSLIDTLSAPTTTKVSPMLEARTANTVSTAGVPFAPRRIATLSPLGYFVAGYPDRYAFEIHIPGRPVTSIRRDVKAEPVPRAERAERRREVEERMRQSVPSWSWSGPDVPETKPYYEDIQVALDGRIWVAVIAETSRRAGSINSSIGGGRGSAPPRPKESTDFDPGKPALYDVFEPDGHYLGQVQVPARVSSVARRGDQVWAVAYDEDDVPHIKRYRIAWSR